MENRKKENRAFVKKCPLQSSQTLSKLKLEIMGYSAKSYNMLAIKYNVHDKTIQNYKADMGIIKFEEKAEPAVSKKQSGAIKHWLRALS